MHDDKAYNKASKNKKIGIVGESHIWDGPLNQVGRIHGVGSSSGIKGIQVLKENKEYKIFSFFKQTFINQLKL